MQIEMCQISVSLVEIGSLVLLLLVENHIETKAMKVRKGICLASSTFARRKSIKPKFLLRNKVIITFSVVSLALRPGPTCLAFQYN